GGADDRARAGARAALAGVRLGTRIAVIAARAVGLRWGRAEPGGGIAGAGAVTLIGGGADDWIAAGADAAVAGVGLRAGIAVVAGRAVRLGRIRTRAGARIAGPGIVALVGPG